VVLGLTACGGSGSSNNGLVRVVNATLNHASLDLLSSATPIVQGTAKDTVSAYAGVAAGSPTLQVNDAGTATALTTIAPTISGSLHYSVIVYESNGSVKAAVLGDDNAAPAVNSVQLRIFDAAPEAGALDVYITDPATLALTTPSFTIPATSAAFTSALLSFNAGTYRIRVTGQGNQNDMRLDMTAPALTSQQIATVLLTASSGGVLIDGGVLVQQGAYAASRNPNARVRLATGVTASATVGAVASNAGASDIVVSPPVVSPAVGAYVVVPATSSLSVNVNGVASNAPNATLTAGGDFTLLVSGPPAAPVPTLLPDDNHLPSTNQQYKMRLVNGGAGNAAVPLTLTADFGLIAASVGVNTGSTYGIGTGSTASRLDLTPAVFAPLTALVLNNNAVYTVFVLGDPVQLTALNNGTLPPPVLRRDR
jgi:hypothetical protein